MTHYPTFRELMESVVLPLHHQHPDWERLDGQTKVGNPAVFATFDYNFKKWRVHKDTNFDRLLAAYDLYLAGNQPFRIILNAKGKPVIRLTSDVTDKANGLYIYLVE